MRENIYCIHKNWYFKKVKYFMTDICQTGFKITYSNSEGDTWVKDERLYQCPKCKVVRAIY